MRGNKNTGREIFVKNTQTGEIKAFSVSIAGMYLMAKFLATDKTHQGIVNAVNVLLYGENLSSIFNRDRGLKVDYIINNKLNAVPNCWAYDMPDVLVPTEFLNTHNECVFGNRRFDEEIVLIDNKYFPKRINDFKKRCECGELYYDQRAIESAMSEGYARRYLSCLPRYLIGYDEYCHDCVEDNLDMCVCADCGKWIDCDDATWVNDEPYCEHCLESNFVQCEECGEWFDTDTNDEYVYTDDERYFCCERCAERYGYHYSEARDEWTRDYDDEDEDSDVIGDYHDHKGYLKPIIAKVDKRKKQKLFSGRETEIDGRSRYDFNRSFYEDLIKDFDGNVVLEKDGTVEIETITRPMDEKSFRNFDVWERGFKKLRDNGWKSHETSNCGTHYHYSIGYLGFNDKERRNNAKKVCRFFQLYGDDVVKIARRNFNSYAEKWHKEITKDTNFDDIADNRYFAVNLDNFYRIGTIEIRICKGTLKTNTMLASWDFFLHIVRNAKRISWKNIDNLKLWLKGIKDKNTIEYIKSRHAFVGAF